MKKFFKKHWITIAIIFSVLLCAVNILLSCLYTSQGANIFTAISGWVSGIATIILGVIAVVQSKRYAFLSMKKELKDEIFNEEKEFAALIGNLIRYSTLTKMLKYLVVIEGNQEVSSLQYKMEVDSTKDQYMFSAVQIQLFKYINSTMSSLVNKIQVMISFFNNEYKVAVEHIGNYELLNKDIENITKNALEWINEMVKLRNSTFTEFTMKRNLIDGCKNIDSLNKLQDDFNKEFDEAKIQTAKMLNGLLEDKK